MTHAELYRYPEAVAIQKRMDQNNIDRIKIEKARMKVLKKEWTCAAAIDFDSQLAECREEGDLLTAQMICLIKQLETQTVLI